MERLFKTILFILTLHFPFCISLSGQTTYSVDQDKNEIDLCIHSLYKCLSYSNGNFEKLDSIYSLFAPEAKLTANFGNQPQTWTVQQFISFVKDGYTKQSITDREEIELFEKTDIFGKIGHRFSTYKINFTIKGKIEIRRGINAIQFLKLNGKWQINSLVWDTEKFSLKIPSTYDPK